MRWFLWETGWPRHGVRVIAKVFSVIARIRPQKICLINVIDFEHSISVEPDNQNGNCYECLHIVRLCIGPYRIVELEMEDDRKQNAAV